MFCLAGLPSQAQTYPTAQQVIQQHQPAVNFDHMYNPESFPPAAKPQAPATGKLIDLSSSGEASDGNNRASLAAASDNTGDGLGGESAHIPLTIKQLEEETRYATI